ncbi:hypothetical protein HDU92_005981 [Lobulomyces angularis]|nr:hypothetical protein HDU92_005981 [Lobulomyces angularis]
MPGSESDCDPWAIEEVDKFLEKVLPNEQVKNYALKKFSSGGANGKSQLLNLMAKSMGGFGTKIDSTLITRRRSDANSASTAKMNYIKDLHILLNQNKRKD